MEEQGREAVARTGVDDDASKPPADARWSDQYRVYLTQRYGKGIRASIAAVRGRGRRRRNEVRLLWWRGVVGQVDFDVDIVGISERGLRHPGQQQRGRGDGARGGRRCRTGFCGLRRGLLLYEGYEAGDVVLCRGRRVDVNLLVVMSVRSWITRYRVLFEDGHQVVPCSSSARASRLSESSGAQSCCTRLPPRHSCRRMKLTEMEGSQSQVLGLSSFDSKHVHIKI